MEKKTTLTLDGITYDLYLGHRAIYRINDELEGGFIGFANRFADGDRDIGAIWKIVWACINSQDKEISFDKFLELLDKEKTSFVNIVETASNLIINSSIMVSSKDLKKKGDSDSKN